jgi:ABC-2 type transport system permease protein
MRPRRPPVRADIARLDLAVRRRSIIGYAAGMAVYTLVVVALYPQFKDSASLNNLTKGGSAAAALFGVTGSLTSPGGWLDANIYENFFPLVMLLLTIGYGAACIAGQDEDGTLALVAVLPRQRRTLIVEKTAAMVVQGLLVGAAVAVCVLIGRGAGLALRPVHVISTSFAVVVMGVDFGVLTAAVGSFTGRRGTALGAGTAIAAASYLVSSLAPVVSWIHPARYASLFYWSVGNDQIANGVGIAGYGILLCAGLAGVTAAVFGFRRLDLH